jgi:ribosomal protein L37AE/L43A
MSEEQVNNFWACTKCGNEFETLIYLTQEAPLTPEVVDTFFSTLLVA